MPQDTAHAYVIANTFSIRQRNGAPQVVDDQNAHGAAWRGNLYFGVRETGPRTGVVQAYGQHIVVNNLVTDELLEQLRNITRDGVTSAREFNSFKYSIDDVMDDGHLNHSIPLLPMVGDNLPKKRGAG